MVDQAINNTLSNPPLGATDDGYFVDIPLVLDVLAHLPATQGGASDSDSIVSQVQITHPQEALTPPLPPPPSPLQQQQQQQPLSLGATSGDSDTVIEGSLHSSNSESGQSSDGLDTAATAAPDFLRTWFFKDMETEPPLPARQLQLVSDDQAPVVIHANAEQETQRFEWNIPVEGIPQGSYELVLGISSLDLKLEAVDSISFDIIYGANKTPDRPCEVISSSYLRDLFDTPTTAATDNAAIAIDDDDSTTAEGVSDVSTTSVAEHSTTVADAENPTTVVNAERSTTDPDPEELVAAANADDLATTIDGDTSSNHITVATKSILRWKLHESIAVAAESDSVSSNGTIKIIMTVETWKSVSSTPGAISLHVLELHQGSGKPYKEDPTIKRHFPFTWFIDINGDTGSPKEIASYCFSGDGAYVAVLVHSSVGQGLELYRIDQNRSCSPLVASWRLSSYKTTEYDISVSWDGSQIVVLNLTNRDQSAIYTRQKHHSKTQARTTVTTDSPQKFNIGLLHSKIRKYFSKGTFHTSASSGNPLKNERFVTFGGTVMAVYSVYGKWKLISKEAIVDPEDPIDLYPDWKENLQGYRLVLLHRDGGYISTRDLTAWYRPISARDLPTTIPSDEIVATCLSECGKYFVMATKDRITLYLTETWTTLGFWSLQKDGDMQGEISGAHFITKNRCASGIVVNTHSTPNPTVDSHGFVVDIDTLTTIERIHSRSLRHYSLTTLDTPDDSTSMFLYESQTTLGAIRYTDRLVRPCSKAATMCTVECGSVGAFQTLSDAECPANIVECDDGSRGRRKTVSMLTVSMQDAKFVHINTMEFPLSEGSKLLGLHQSVLDGHSYMVIALSSLILVWRISASLEGDCDLLWAEGTNADAEWSLCDGEYTLVIAEGDDVETEWRLCQHHQLHRCDNTSDISTRNLLDLHIPNPDAFLDGIVRLVEIFKDADETTKRAIIRYTERHINQCLDPENDSAAILTRLCASWSAGFHEHLLAFVRALFGSPSFHWVPKPTMSQESNPISILIDRLKDNLYVLDIVEIMINYCVRLAKVDSDLHFLGPITQSLRITLEFQGVDSGVFARMLRSFAYFPAREYHFAVDHHAVADPPFDSNKKKMLHECKDPVLELSAKPIVVHINKRLTPRLYVASFDMLWSYEEIPTSKKKHWAFIQKALLFLTLMSNKRCICHPFDLDDLDNPAIVALVRYKWMKVGFPFWLFQTLFYGYITVFFLVRIFYDIYGKGDPVYSETVWIINVAFSWIFALGALRDLVVLTAVLRMKPRGSVYSVVEILTSLIPTIAYLAGSPITVDLINSNIYESFLSASILFTLLQFLLMFRVMKTVGGFLSVLWRTFHSIWVFLAMFAYIIFAYAVSFLYLQYVVCMDDDCSNIPKSKPENFFMATTFTYFMTGGMYEFVETNIKNRNWKVHLMLASFLFVVTIMLNILFGMVNHAFDSDGRIPELEWVEERMYLITRAENFFRGLRHFLLYDSEKNPDKIYYTATPTQVRKYKLETHRLHEEAAAAALPLEVDFPDDAKAWNPSPERAIIATEQESLTQVQEQEQRGEDQQQSQYSSPHPQQQQQLEDWPNRLKELKEHLEAQKKQMDEQLKAQKKQMDEQLEAQKKQMDELLEAQKKQLDERSTQLDQRNDKLEDYISRFLTAFESSARSTPDKE
ncbi:MAG: hypothetical protein J3R72DRAFT_93092 [Linnemannia gamsii]|nr:MAG: hypothetical protein J3R72DRAFT_93092 [Linnemannia gamsii]